jgi:glucose-6-phosphate isomerase
MQNTKAYVKLQQHYAQQKNKTLKDLFNEESDRGAKFNLSVNGLNLDYAKNNITSSTLMLLTELAQESNVLDKIQAMFNGQKLNSTENRAVLHTALRSKAQTIMVDNVNVMEEITKVLDRMKNFANKLHQNIHLGYTGKPITDIVNIGIGGSDLGPNFVCEALKPYRKNNLNVHFISSVDGYHVLDCLNSLNHETTLFVIASKTFTTQETITNAHTARNWFLTKTNNNEAAIKNHFIAASTNTKAVAEFGIDPDNMFEFWDFVGGRYSLWSAIGISIILYIGFDNFEELLTGAGEMDQHFLNTTDLSINMPVIFAILGIWYINFYNYSALVISPYNTRLKKFPAYIQQLEMESNGKSLNRNGNEINYKTCPIIWGDSGINGQHAYYQLLHQGTSIYPMDIILALSDKHSNKEHNQILQANAIAQAEAFMLGKTFAQAKNELEAQNYQGQDIDIIAKHKMFSGNRPTNLLTFDEISPKAIGNLIALYEHKTFVQGIIWQINSFDQWGVELGKQLAKTVLQDIQQNKISTHDSSTARIINICLQNK